MRVSPLDIRKQEFTRGFRGYEVEEVDAFLQMLSREWEEMRDEQRRLEEQIRSTDDKLRHYERVEEALQEALQTARDSTRKTLQNAEEKARLIIQQAESEANAIKRGAIEQRDATKKENARLLNRQHEIVARLRAFLSSEMEMLNRYRGDELVGSESPEVSRAVSPEVVADPSPRAEIRSRPSAKEVFSEQSEEPEEGSDQAFHIRSFVRQEAEIAAPEAEETEETAEPASRDEEEGIQHPAAELEESGEEPQDKTKVRQATEEIEKIRRILNDLD
ncbi:MAG: DivIVA domain-containing protein [Bacteroidota bacterium]